MQLHIHIQARDSDPRGEKISFPGGWVVWKKEGTSALTTTTLIRLSTHAECL